ncbi:hypothetical protein Rin_00021600 [Candidatus Regiella insecticola 5.15]|uniref:Uncharacterized protein n=2 Tax=Candidatus Regiella insecticola TaxID=138073 RepID=G2H262_9ENTR|nr:hypothetical protein Rin_00021600 [Candidatus Regiella insecticola 5.15]
MGKLSKMICKTLILMINNYYVLSTSDIPFTSEVAARRPGGETDERGHTMRARAGSQQRDGFKGEGYKERS